MKTILKGKEWNNFLTKNKLTEKKQMEIYSFTYNFTSVYKLDGYYFTFGILAGYKNKASIKKAITKNYNN